MENYENVLVICVLLLASIGFCSSYGVGFDKHKSECAGDDCSFIVSNCLSDDCKCDELYVTRSKKECSGWFWWKHCEESLSNQYPEKYKCNIPHAHECPITEWGDCSKTCGGGVKTRQVTSIREGTPEQPCVSSVETEPAPCNEEECPETGDRCTSLSPDVFINEIIVDETASSIDVEIVKVDDGSSNIDFKFEIHHIAENSKSPIEIPPFQVSDGLAYSKVHVGLMGSFENVVVTVSDSDSNEVYYDAIGFDLSASNPIPDTIVINYEQGKSTSRTGTGCSKDDFVFDLFPEGTPNEVNMNQNFRPSEEK